LNFESILNDSILKQKYFRKSFKIKEFEFDSKFEFQNSKLNFDF